MRFAIAGCQAPAPEQVQAVLGPVQLDLGALVGLLLGIQELAGEDGLPVQLGGALVVRHFL